MAKRSPSRAVIPAVFFTAAAVSMSSTARESQQAHAPEAGSASKTEPLQPATPIQKVEIKGSGSDYDARRYDTASKIVVQREEILRYGDRTVADALKRLPGVTTGGGIRMRGLGNGYTQVLINGDPMPAGFSLESLNPDLIERIEIMRSASAEYSTQAVAGTINIIVRRVVQKGKREVKPGFFYDTDPTAFANYEVSDKSDKFSYVIGGRLITGRYGFESEIGESAINPEGQLVRTRHTRRDFNVRLSGLNLAPRLTWTPNEENSVSLQSLLSYNRNRVQEEQETAVGIGVAPPFERSPGSRRLDSLLSKSDLSWSRKLEKGRKFDFKIGVNTLREINDLRLNSFDFNDELALVARDDATNSDYGLTSTGKYSGRLIEGHSFVLGWDGGVSHRREERFKMETSPTGLIPDNKDEEARGTVRRIALFAQDEWAVTERLSVYGGVRWEQISTVVGFAGANSVRNRSSVVSPTVQTLYKLPQSKNDQVRLALARTYKAPDTFALLPRQVFQRDNSEVNPDLIGNPNLRPELAWGLDIAYEHFLESGGSFSLSGYRRSIDDVTRTRTLQQDGRWIAFTENAGGARSHGIEVDMKMPLRSLSEAMPKIDLRFNLAKNWSNVELVPGPGNRLDAQVPLSGTFGLDYTSAAKLISLGTSFTYQGAGEVRVASDQFKYASPRRILDSYVLYTFNPKHQLRVSLSNILREDRLSRTRVVTSRGLSSIATREPSFTTIRAVLEMQL